MNLDQLLKYLTADIGHWTPLGERNKHGNVTTTTSTQKEVVMHGLNATNAAIM